MDMAIDKALQEAELLGIVGVEGCVARFHETVADLLREPPRGL